MTTPNIDKKTILLTEDDCSLAKTIRSVLEKNNFQVLHVENGLEAIKLLPAQHFDLVLTDIRMPLLSGTELLQFIRKGYPTMPVILMTGFSEIMEAKEAYDLGANGFLPKPFSIKDLLATITAQFRQSVITQENLDDQYAKIRIDEFISGKEIGYDIFIRINDRKFVKVANGGESIDISRIRAYTSAGLEYLYIKKEDFKSYTNFTLSLAVKVQGSNSFNRVRKRAVLLETSKSILSTLYHNDIDKDQYDIGSSVVLSTIDTITEDDTISELLDGLQNHGDRLFAHSMAVSVYAVMVAKSIGWISLKTKVLLSMCGLFHDLGLKEIPLEIVNKNRVLRKADETRLYESHPIRGMEILSALPNIPDETRLSAQFHHEDCNGLGYPQRLSRAKTTSISRLIYVVNELCELTHPVTDEKGLTPLEAFEKMTQSSVGRFDKTYLEGLKILLKIKD